MILIVMWMVAGMTADGDDLAIMIKNLRGLLQRREAKSNCPNVIMTIMIGKIMIMIILIVVTIMIIITSSWSRSKEQLSGRGRAKRSTTTAA